MDNEIIKVVEILKEGKTILYPTDTIWGLGCDATNGEAVKRIYEIKGRQDSKALIILISDIEQLRDYVQQIPDIAWDLVEFAEKPLTVIYPKGRGLAENLLAEDGSVAIRLVKDEFCRKVIRKLKKAIVSTSANISGESAPAHFGEISPAILSAVDYTVNLRQNERSPSRPSTIVKLELDGGIKFIRK